MDIDGHLFASYLDRSPEYQGPTSATISRWLETLVARIAAP